MSSILADCISRTRASAASRLSSGGRNTQVLVTSRRSSLRNVAWLPWALNQAPSAEISSSLSSGPKV